MSADCYSDSSTGRVTLRTVRGDSFGFLVRCWQDVDKTIATDFTGATVRAQVRMTPDAPEIEASFEVAIEGNELRLVLLPTQTATLPASNVWDVECDWASDGTSIQTLASGVLQVGADVTRTG